MTRLADLPVQACYRHRFHGFLAPAHILYWYCLGCALASSKLGGRHPLCSARAHAQVYQPWRIPAQRGQLQSATANC